MLQSPYILGGSYGSDTERVAQYVMRYATRGTHVYQYVPSQCVNFVSACNNYCKFIN